MSLVSSFRRKAKEEVAELLERIRLQPMLRKVMPLTAVHESRLVHLSRVVRDILESDIPGEFVECGVYRGGASFFMAELLRAFGIEDRKVWMFDSFEGLPAPEAIDGEAALAFTQRVKDPPYYGSFRASLEDVERNAARLGLVSHVELIKGWFEQTLPTYREKIGPIAILRLDCDWYASVRCCLDNLFDQVSPGGYVIFDDYYEFDGCALAVHEFLGTHHLTHRLEFSKGEVFLRKSASGATGVIP